jgi:hypothetical protein
MTNQIPPTLYRYKFTDENYNPITVESERVDEIIERSKRPCPMYTPVFRPFFDIELYIFMVGLKGADAEAVREKYPCQNPNTMLQDRTNKPRVINKYGVPDDPDWVKVEITVTPKGRVKVSMCAPLEVLKPYTEQGHLAPIEVRLKAAQKFGCALFSRCVLQVVDGRSQVPHGGSREHVAASRVLGPRG